jgi:hypothetical protein
MSFKFKASKLLQGLAEKEIRTKAALGLYADTAAKKMENESKANATWKDRTGAARQRLNSTWKWQGNIVRIELSHGVDYGIWLELCNEGKYAVITPTINKMSPKIIQGLDKILK